MAKVYFGKLNLSVNKDIKKIQLPDGTEVEVKQYLPVEEKMNIMDRVISRAVTDKGYYSPSIIEILLTVETIFAYTNIAITDKQKEDIYKVYDMFVSSGVYSLIKEAIPAAELYFIKEYTYQFIKIFSDYRNSAVGIMDIINTDYSNTALDAKAIQESLGDKDNLGLVKDILEKLG